MQNMYRICFSEESGGQYMLLSAADLFYVSIRNWL